MRKHLSAAHARARAARTCLGIITGSLIVIGLTACGGGDDAAPGNTAAQPQNLSDAPARAQAVPVTAPTTLVKDTGWSAALPALQPWSYTPPTITGKIHYIDSVYSTAVLTDPARDGTTPATAWGNLRDFKNMVLASADPAKKLQPGDAILFKCGGVWREGLELKNYSNLRIGTYQAGQTGPRDCSDDQLPILRASEWGGRLAWAPTDNSNAVYSATLAEGVKILRMFKDTLPLTEARYPNADSAQPFLLASPVEQNPGESDSDYDTRKRSEFKVHSSEINTFSGNNNPIKDAVIYVKSAAWLIQSKAVSSYDAATGIVKLSSPVDFAIEEGTGYYLAGRQWMMDQPGEWSQEFTQTNTRTVYYRPNDQTANGLEFTWTSAKVDNLYHGIKIITGSNIEISRLRFEHQEYASLGIEGSSDITIKGVESLFAHEIGINVARGGTSPNKPSQNVLVESSKVRGAGAYGIFAGGIHQDIYPKASNVTVRNNLVMHTGLYGTGASIKERTAIRIGGRGQDESGGPYKDGPPDAQAIGNIVLNNAGGGIVLDNGRHGAIIDGNTVVNSCMQATDCGAIYANNTKASQPAAEGTTSAKISNNLIIGVKGNIDGARVGSESNRLGREQAFGIYLDDRAANVEVFNNQISHASGGIYLHNTAWTDIHHNEVKRVTLASIKVNSDRPAINGVEQMRGNVIHDNTLFSHRTVDSNQFAATASLSDGIQGAAPQVYAQVWLHNTSNPSVFFTGDRRNESRNNTVLTHSKVSASLPSTWRTNSAYVSNNNAPQTTQSSGGIWWLKTLTTNGYNKEMALPEWLNRVQATTSTADAESSPMSYRPFVLTLGNGGNSLINPIAQGSGWTWNAASQVPYATGASTCGEASVCASVTASQSWHSLMSNPFQTTSGQLYFAKYTLKQGTVKGIHNATVRRSTDSAMVGEYLQNVETNPGEVRYYEHFFRANANSGTNTVLALKPSDGVANSTNPYTTQYFSDATVHLVDAVAVLPGLDQLGVTAVNASAAARTFSCAEDLGIAQANCSSVRDEDNQPVTFPVSVDARTMKRFYVHSSTWSN